MRIAFLTPEFVTEDNFDGGLSSYLGRVTTALVKRGHKVEVFVSSDKQGTIDYQGVFVHRVRNGYIGRLGIFLRTILLINNLLNRCKLPAFPSTLSTITTIYSLGLAILSRSKSVNFDVIQATSYQATALFPGLKRIAPVVVRVSSYPPLLSKEYKRQKSLDVWISDRLEILSVFSGVACYAPSELISNYYQKFEKIHLEVISSPIHFENFELNDSLYKAISDGRKYTIHFGTIGRLKGSGVLADVIPRLLEQNKDFRIVVAGKVLGEDGEKLVQRSKQYPDHVLYLGKVHPSQLYPVIKGASFVILPSLLDNLPNTALESMALGKPIVGTYEGGFDQLVENRKSGLLIHAAEPEELVRSISELWQMPPHEVYEWGVNAKGRISNLHPDVVIPKLEDFFHSLIDTVGDRKISIS
jgi:glycogen synthase